MKSEAKRSDESDFMQLLDVVHCIDNCKGMMMLPDECIDLVVTSPPYDDLRTYGGHSWDFYGVAWNLARVLKHGGVIVWVVADATKDGSETGTSMRQALHFQSMGLNLHDTMIWHKNNAMPLNDNRYEQAWEYVFIFSKGKPAKWAPLKEPSKMAGKTATGTQIEKDGSRHSKNGNGKKINSEKVKQNVWAFPVGIEKNGHPAPFPEQMAASHIQSWSNKGDIVLDPFMGSGTTAKAAQELSRHYIGFEINSEYVEICRQRTAQATLGI